MRFLLTNKIKKFLNGEALNEAKKKKNIIELKLPKSVN